MTTGAVFRAACNRLARLVLGLCMGLIVLAIPAAHAIEAREVKTPRGITVWFAEDHTVPIVAMNYAFRGGAAADPADRQGLAAFLAAMLDEGAGDLDAAAFQERMEELAFSMSHTAGRDWFTGSFRSLSRNLEESARLLALAINRPRFDPAPLERVRQQLLVALRNKEQDPEEQAWRAFLRMLYGDHPYGRDVDGTPEGVKAITADDLRALHGRLFARDNLMVVVAGDIDEKRMVRLVDSVFGDLPERSAMPEIPEPTFPQKAREKVVRRPIPQSIVLMGAPSLRRNDPDFIPAYVVNHILGGGGFGSRLMDEVREKRGLAYSVYSALATHEKDGYFFAYAATRNEKALLARDIMLEIIRQVAREGVTREELEAAKDYLIGSWPLRFDSTTKVARMLLGLRLQGLGLDYLEKRNDLMRAVTLDDAKRAARRMLQPERMQVVIYGNPQQQAQRPASPGVQTSSSRKPQGASRPTQ